MKKYLFLLFCLLLFGSTLKSQHQINRCATHERIVERLKEHPEDIVNREAIERFTENWISHQSANKKSSGTITIPVVIHVVYKTSAENISDAQIQSQLDVLNKDYRRLNTDTTLTPQPFKSLAADCEIEFCLATQDPNGHLTTGITRKLTTINFIGNTSKYYLSASGGEDIWNHNAYLNIWVCNIDGGGTLGFAWPPGNTGAQDDGVVIDYRYFGTLGKSPPYHLGRTVTHEVGHFFNLEHIWGDESGCIGTDNVADTPNQGAEDYDCPTFPVSTDPCTPSFPGIMFMNYMDYSDDNCMNMFTKGQKQRMVAAVNGPRISLQASKGCQTPSSIAERNFEISTHIYPNPSEGLFVIDLNNKVESCQIIASDLLGKIIFMNSFPTVSSPLKLDLSGYANGIYFVKIKTKEGISVHKVVLENRGR